jgi:ABC-type sugar transport system substrate-binding protein
VGFVTRNPGRAVRILGLAFCLAGALAVGAAAAGKVVFGLCLAEQDSPFSQEIRQGVEDAGRKWGFAVEVRNAGGQAATQAEDVAAFVKAGVTALVIQPVEAAALTPALTAAAKASIPVGTMVTAVAPGLSGVHVDTNHRAAGRLAAQQIQLLVPGGGIVYAVGSDDPASLDKLGGFETALEGTPYKVVRIRAAARPQAAAAVEASAKEVGTPPAAVFGCTPELALGALRGLNAVPGGPAVPVIAYGTNAEAHKALRLGRFAALVTDKGWDIGQIAAEATAGLLRGKKPWEKLVPADPLLVLK